MRRDLQRGQGDLAGVHTAVGDLHGGDGLVTGINRHGVHLDQPVKPMDHLPEDNVDTIEVGDAVDAHAELGAVGVGTSVSHGHGAQAPVGPGLPLEGLIGELAPNEDALPASAVPHGDVAALGDEVLDHAVEVRALVVERVALAADAALAGADAAEVLGGLRDGIREELNHHAAALAVERNVEEHLRVVRVDLPGGGRGLVEREVAGRGGRSSGGGEAATGGGAEGLGRGTEPGGRAGEAASGTRETLGGAESLGGTGEALRSAEALGRGAVALGGAASTGETGRGTAGTREALGGAIALGRAVSAREALGCTITLWGTGGTGERLRRTELLRSTEALGSTVTLGSTRGTTGLAGETTTELSTTGSATTVLHDFYKKFRNRSGLWTKNPPAEEFWDPWGPSFNVITIHSNSNFAFHVMPKPVRTYFFYLSKYGKLYPVMEPRSLFGRGAQVPYGPVHLKDDRFLDFFFRRLKVNDECDASPHLFPYVSYCQGERNLLLTADSPVVFHSLVDDGGERKLLYAGRSAMPFNPKSVVFDPRGYFYHPTVLSAPSGGAPPAKIGAPTLLEYGLISTNVMAGLTDHIVETIDNDEAVTSFFGHRLQSLPNNIATLLADLRSRQLTELAPDWELGPGHQLTQMGRSGESV